MSANSVSSKSRGKRKASTDDPTTSLASDSTKRARTTKNTKANLVTHKANNVPPWPEYFDSLFKIFKALNTVLAFCASRKNFAITFPVVRKSVEGLIKQPLELSRVAELKALLPDLVKFAYTPRIELQIHGDSQSSGTGRENSPDYSRFQTLAESSRAPINAEEEEHVLVLDFVDNVKGKKLFQHGYIQSVSPSLTPAATKKLVEKRNNRFVQAVNELLEATADSDTIALLQAAARDHIPINPSSKTSMDALTQSSTQGRQQEIPNSNERPSIETVLEEIQEQDWYKNQLVEKRVFAAQDGQQGELDRPLSNSIKQALRESRNITFLYTHQAAAINALQRNRHVIVSTSTASGKSVIYQVPLLQFLEDDIDSTAVFIYPTKALAQDQRAALEQLLIACPGLEHIKVATYDGDTPQEKRREIRETASVIFTNFDMIHASILPHEHLWRRFLKNLKLVAVDELHYYSNIFGSHVAQIIRRFRRVCAVVGNRHCHFVSCSATIGKPKQHMQNLFGINEVEVITEDGAPTGRKDFIIWQPSPIDPEDPSLGRQSSISEGTRLMRFLMTRGIRVIMFCKMRNICEIAMKTLRTELTADGRLDILDRVMSYRGGYSPQDRRRIEHEAFSGSLLGIVATNALELGVDIGVLDAVIIIGFPMGGVASFRQEAGRAGRRARDALAAFVPDGLPVSQYYVNNPDELFSKSMSDLSIDLDSSIILEAHLHCAAHEMPLALEDEIYFGPLMKTICETRLVKDNEGWFHPHPKFLPSPARHIALRGAEEEKYSVTDVTGGGARILEETEVSRALFELYEGAVFIHQGKTFLVKEVNHDTMVARLIRSDVNWTTRSRDFTDVDAVQTHRIRELRNSPHRAYYGRVDVKTVVFGFFKLRNHTIIDAVDVDMPLWERETCGLWMDIPKNILELIQATGINTAEAIHSAEHAFMNRFDLAADLRTECKAPEKEYKSTASTRRRPARIIFYETVGKNGGVAVRAFDHVSDLLLNALETVDACSCSEGCVQCIISPSCSERNEVASKAGALIILKALLGRPIDTDLLVPVKQSSQFETIVEANYVRAIENVEVEVD